MFITLSQIIWIFATIIIPVPIIYIIIRYLSGKISRHYETISFTDSVIIAEKGLFLEEFGTKFAPAIVHPPDLGEEPEVCLFDVIEQDTTYLINYWISWRDEIHPNSIVDEIFRIFRHTYYGGKTTKDIEQIQIIVSKKTGYVTNVKFRTEPHNKPDVFFPRRKLMVINKTDNGYMRIVGDTEQEIHPTFLYNSRVKLKVQTWNHLFTITEDGVTLDIPLLWMDANLYRNLKITRRSGGKENLVDWIITVTSILVIMYGWLMLTL